MNQKNMVIAWIVLVLMLAAVAAIIIVPVLLLSGSNDGGFPGGTQSGSGFPRPFATHDGLGLVEIAASQTAERTTQTAGGLSPAEIAATQTADDWPPTTLGMGLIEVAASQTTSALLVSPTPTATLMPGLKYWSPASTSHTGLRFLYDSTHWALTDAGTLASLEISGCTLRLAGGHGLGPGWSTEETTFATGSVSFLKIVSKFQDQAQFVTYSGPDQVVFEITAPGLQDSCIQAGESIIKSVTVY